MSEYLATWGSDKRQGHATLFLHGSASGVGRCHHGFCVRPLVNRFSVCFRLKNLHSVNKFAQSAFHVPPSLVVRADPTQVPDVVRFAGRLDVGNFWTTRGGRTEQRVVVWGSCYFCFILIARARYKHPPAATTCFVMVPVRGRQGHPLLASSICGNATSSEQMRGARVRIYVRFLLGSICVVCASGASAVWSFTFSLGFTFSHLDVARPPCPDLSPPGLISSDPPPQTT